MSYIASENQLLANMKMRFIEDVLSEVPDSFEAEKHEIKKKMMNMKHADLIKTANELSVLEHTMKKATMDYCIYLYGLVKQEKK